MDNQSERQGQKKSGGAPTGGDEESGDPGRTPGKAEGDEETVDESLQQKEKTIK